MTEPKPCPAVFAPGDGAIEITCDGLAGHKNKAHSRVHREDGAISWSVSWYDTATGVRKLGNGKWSVVEETKRHRLRNERQMPKRLQEDRLYGHFWTSLEINQEVRWTGARTMTYFVHSLSMMGTPLFLTNKMGVEEPFIELRRRSGKTFATPLRWVRPLDWQPKRRQDR